MFILLMPTIEELTLSKKELKEAGRNILKSSIKTYGALALMGWLGFGSMTGIWIPKQYKQYFKEKAQSETNQIYLNDSQSYNIF